MSETEAVRERDRRELIGPDGGLLGIMWGVWSDEPCWKRLDMFFASFRFEPTPPFDRYRPMFDGLNRALKAETERFEAWLAYQRRSRLRRLVGWVWDPKRKELEQSRSVVRRFRQQIFESVRIRTPDDVWTPPVIYIDGDCGYYRVSKVRRTA